MEDNGGAEVDRYDNGGPSRIEPRKRYSRTACSDSESEARVRGDEFEERASYEFTVDGMRLWRNVCWCAEIQSAVTAMVLLQDRLDLLRSEG